MRGKVIGSVVLVLALLLLATPGLVAARGGHGGGGGQGDSSFQIYGEIDSLDDNALTITVLVETPASLYGDYILVQTTDSTRFKECLGVKGTGERISFDDLVVTLDVKISGTVVDGAYVADSVIQYVPEE